LLGPTAAGKTEWAISWQKQFDVLEIISVDSVMVYKECNIGSAKPTNEVLKNHPHHLVNHVSLDCVFSVADFYDSSLKLIQKIHARDKVPLMVGGSMMYFNLLKNGMSTLPSANQSLRKELEDKIANYGIKNLHVDLERLDPNAAKAIKPQDSQRIIRAIEIIISTGRSLDANFLASEPSLLKEKYQVIEYGIFPNKREELHERIEARQESLVGKKLLEEIFQIQDSFNISSEHPAMKAINYRQGLQVINGQLNKSELYEKSLFATRQFAKRQCTWMRGWENLAYFDLHHLEVATEELKKQLNLLEII
tara:strand:+ start:2237 stop:3160 length:924 start_codon:yes stop_codon:yes gene_type:complete